MSLFPSRRAKAGPRPRTARQRVLFQWHRLDLQALEQDRGTRTRSANGVLPAVLDDLGLDRRRAETEIVKVWNHLMDPAVAAHAQPVGLRNGTLFVNVDSSAWLDEIVRYRRKEILTRLQHSFGRDLIVRISFRVG
jgi:Dna[CI] antecedent, DciA